jgi:hypothetical protein
MLRVEFEPKVPVLEREKTVHASDHAASSVTVTFQTCMDKGTEEDRFERQIG